MSIGFGSLTWSLPYWPITRIDRPCGVVTALIVSLVDSEPGDRRVRTCRGFVGSDTSTTATPAPGAGFGLLSGATASDGPATYAQLPAHAMLALPVGGRPPWSSVAWPTSASPQL